MLGSRRSAKGACLVTFVEKRSSSARCEIKGLGHCPPEEESRVDCSLGFCIMGR